MDFVCIVIFMIRGPDFAFHVIIKCDNNMMNDQFAKRNDKGYFVTSGWQK